jgi:DNA-directed RNA polymerase specialized sigma24 family protein
MEIPFDFRTSFINGKSEIIASDLPWFETPSEQKARWQGEEERRHLKKMVEAVLSRLTPNQQIAYRLRQKGKTYREIAEIMEVNVKTAWEYIRGRKGLHGGAIRAIQKLLGIETPEQ